MKKKKTSVYEWHERFCDGRTNMVDNPRIVRLGKGKVMLKMFFDYKGVIHYKFIPEDQAIKKEFLPGDLKQLQDKIK